MKKPKLKTVLTGADFQAMSDLMGGLLDKQAAVLASKKDLSVAEHRIKTELKDCMHEGFEAVMEGIDAVAEKLAEKVKIERLIKCAKIPIAQTT
jgi:hypothetical protein